MDVSGRLKKYRLVLKELLLTTIFGLIISAILILNDASELFYRFSRAHEYMELDEIIFVLAVVVPLCLAIFSVRRWRDISRLFKEANTDPLTGVMNRRRGWEVIEEEIARSRRYNHPLSLIMFDLDYFKKINDSLGHLVGDRVLATVAHAVAKIIRQTDPLVRWGGEEFLIVCPETAVADARRLAERARRQISEIDVPDLPGITASFGVKQWRPNEDFFDLIKAVDTFMYQAKKNGRNQVAG